ncbi:hypothetical protein [Paenibacillus harenae]|uniref:Uncharacterized protein n=1 Tax=Paenibacillus harenae TaxID=306543 RepID=A0ABT9TYI6_PAEHA|nr:hypothetical protein [Paenibacillus harenae]MDQ0060505.1 hypothetical protein [Paenibacillus harenae]MDQ0111956.1 hypothetical protein [Paenibacillus harenae]
MNKKTLLDWEASHDAIKQTVDGFWRIFSKWREEEREDYLKTFHGKLYDEFISVEERAIYLKFNFNAGEAVIICSINIFYLEMHIGTFDIEFSLDGEVADEYLDFDDVLSKDRILEIKHFLRVARNSIKVGLEITTISNITGIDAKYLRILKEKYC